MKNKNTKTNKNTYKLVYFNHGAWGSPSKTFTNLKDPVTMARITTEAAALRKQPARLIKVS
jgi:hypothetical protein